MRVFEIFVDDDRYSVPTLRLSDALDETQARREAVALLLNSPHHLGVELCRDGDRILGLGSFAGGARRAETGAGLARPAE